MPVKPKPKANIWFTPKSNANGQWSSNNDTRYHSTKWRTIRANQLKKQPLCKLCNDKGIITSATIADHIKAVRLGGEFWSSDNLQSLCVRCHNAKRD